MKKIIFMLLIIPIMISCNRNKIERLESRNDSLMQVTNAKDQSLNEFLNAFNSIQNNLDSIREKEMLITEKTANKTELKKPAQDQINEEINDIYNLLKETREKLENTKSKLGKSNTELSEMTKMLDRLSAQLEEKNKEIVELRAELESMNIKITSLTENVTELTQESAQQTSVIEKQEEMLEEKTSALNTAYYAAGPKKMLRENNIITLEGGFIGLGKEEKLKDDLNQQAFTTIDIRETLTISIPGDKAEIVTPHPPESYTIEGEDDEQVLKITNYKSFWKSTKYLVVITD